MTDRFIEALEAYVDARIRLAGTDPHPLSKASRAMREEAENEAGYTRADMLDAVAALSRG
jgi:hypothetical protein